jgi:hypothetical protein
VKQPKGFPERSASVIDRLLPEGAAAEFSRQRNYGV